MCNTRLKTFVYLPLVVLASYTVGATAVNIEPQASSEQGVTLRVTPVDVTAGAARWTFEISLDTHSGSLSDDLARTATLLDASGKPHAPLGWEGSAPGGHHRKGTLQFAPITPRPPTLEMRIQRPGESAARRFRWRLE